MKSTNISVGAWRDDPAVRSMNYSSCLISSSHLKLLLLLSTAHHSSRSNDIPFRSPWADMYMHDTYKLFLSHAHMHAHAHKERDLFLLFHVYECFDCMCVFAPHARLVPEGVVSLHVGAGNETWALCKKDKCALQFSQISTPQKK